MDKKESRISFVTIPLLLRIVFLLLLTVSLFSCYVGPNCDLEPDYELAGWQYVNKETLDTITFAENNIIIFEWKTDPAYWWIKDIPYQRPYCVDDIGDIYLSRAMTSGEGARRARFPYQWLRLVESRQAIICTGKSGGQETFLRGEVKVDLKGRVEEAGPLF